MDSLISRQDAINAILADKIVGKALIVMNALGDGRLALTLNDACDRHIRAIEQLPSAEPEVIHCKDCKYMRRDVIFDQCWCNRSSMVSPIDDDEYCSRADRRKE